MTNSSADWVSYAPTGAGLLLAGGLALFAMGFVFALHRFAAGEPPRRPGIALAGERAHPILKRTGTSVFVWPQLLAGGFYLLFGSPGVSAHTFFPALFVVSNVLALTLSIVVAVRPGTGIGRLLQGTERQPQLAGISLKVAVRQFSLLLTLALASSFGFSQFDRYGLLTPAMALYLLFLWVFLYIRLADEELELSTFEMRDEPFGFLAIWRELVFVPFGLTCVGFALVDRVLPEPSWFIWPPLVVYIAALAVWWSARAQRARVDADPDGAIWWGGPMKVVGRRFPVSGWWGIVRCVPDVALAVMVLCIARTTGTSTRLQYLVPLAFFIYSALQTLRDERQLAANVAEEFALYRSEVRHRWVPGVF